MQQATQIALARRVFDFVERDTTELADAIFLNPVASYTCPQQAQRERDRLFRDHPLFFGLSCELPKPGDYRADDLSGMPVLVVRAQDGRLRAFLNVCRHRGAKVATGSGSGKRVFVCPYHAFTYDLEGRLTKLQSQGFPELTCEERSLVQIPVAERHGLIWVRATPGGEIDVDALLGGLAPEMASYNLASYSHYETRTLTKEMNWKLVIDTFLETWHVATLHRETVGPIFQPNVNAFDAFGYNGRLIIPRRSLLGLRKEPESSWDLLMHSAIVYTLFPNALLVWQGDHVETWRSFPVGTDTSRCTAEAALFTPTPATADKAKQHWDRNMDLLMRTVDAEDFPVCLDIQRGFAAQAQQHMTFGRNEPALAHYHRSLRQALGPEEPCARAPTESKWPTPANPALQQFTEMVVTHQPESPGMLGTTSGSS
jgi:phenylpropionate dioxygenase-like ring-hydroxylating dioxygenase large terminal subunit